MIYGTSSNYNAWSYAYSYEDSPENHYDYAAKNSSKYGASLTYTESDSIYEVWENRGDLEACNENMQGTILTTINNSDVSISDCNGKTVANFNYGKFSSNNDNIVQSIDECNPSKDIDNVQIWLPVGDYSIINNSNDEELDVTVLDDYQSADVKTDASEINIHVDDDSKLNIVEIEESGCTFDIDMTSQLTNSCESVEAIGIIPKSSVSLQQKNGSVTLTADGVKLNGDLEDIDGDANDVSDETADGSVGDDSISSLLGSSMKLRINGVNIPLSSSKTTVSYKNFYNITFNTNGGSSISKVKAYSNAAFDLSSYKPQKDGYLFAGWYKSSALSGTSLKEIASGRTSNITFYAKWIKGVVGDADGDGVITAADASMMLLVSSGAVTLDDAGKLASDAVTGNNYSDKALRILDYMTGKNGEL